MQPPVGTRGYFPGVKRPEHEVDYSPPSSAKIKNEWSCTYTLHTVSWRGQGKLYLFATVSRPWICCSVNALPSATVGEGGGGLEADN